MIDLVEKLNDKFENKYSYLKLFNIVYDKNLQECTISFLFPYTIEEIKAQDKQEVLEFIKALINIQGNLVVKFKRSYLDERLIIENIVEFFKEQKKGLVPYISLENIKVSHNELDVFVEIKINQDILALIDDFELKNQLNNYLSKLYVANFQISIVENEESLPDQLECEELLPTPVKARRYNVVAEKRLIGSEIIPKPEYIKDNTKQKNSVILAGFMTNKTQKKFIIKKGKHIGEEKLLYNFSLKDIDGSIECVYFCPKTYEKAMESLEDNTFILCVGDLRIGITGKLTYYIKKITLASPLFEEAKREEDLSIEQILKNHKQVVFPDMLPRSTQEYLFDQKASYNDFILKNNIVVLDLETTGLDTELCEITEIGAVKIEKGEITERFSSFAKPKFPIPLEVQKLTNITNEMVAKAPKIEDVIIDFCEWSKDCIISGYNIVGFDLKFIKKITNKLNLPFTNTVIDTLIVSKQANIHPANYKLGTVVKYFGLELEGAHRAFNDAYATAQVLMELNRKKTKEQNN